MRESAHTRSGSWIVLMLNLALVVAVVVLFFTYVRDYNAKLYEQNLNDIGNVNRASARIASELSESHEQKLNNILRYASRYPLTLDELMTYVDDANADESVVFQLIGADYNGYVLERDADGAFPAVSYANRDYFKMQQIVDADGGAADAVPFTVEFTDPNTGSRSFARYVRVPAISDGVTERYTLLAVFKSAAFVEHINLNGGFVGMSTVLINTDGSYALRNTDFKSDNFYKYLYVYNDLTLDQMSEIQSRVLAGDGGTLRYKNSVGAECAFVYSDVPGTDWYCVSCVPVANFHNASPDFMFTWALALLLGTLMVIDIVYLAQINRRLKQSAAAANAANVAKTDFLSRMSHDIRTPINVISGMTELALAEPNPPKTNDYLSNIRASGKFLLGLINDILDMNKVESGNMELHVKPYPASEFVAYINAVIRPLCAEKGVQFEMRGDTTGMVWMLDPLRFNQICFNLLSNAAKFTPEGGHVTLTCECASAEGARALLDVTVADDGVGMSETFQKTMFLPFSQESRTQERNKSGTGLGLAIVKRLVDLMGGTICVESEIGKGTAFHIHMETDLAPASETGDSSQGAECDLTGRHVLLCEDHPLNTMIMVELLAQRSIVVETAENGQIGVDMFKASAIDYYDVILMDIQMPVMNGLEASGAIRALAERPDAKRVPIVALTANAYDSDVKRCLDAGMTAHLAKPVDTAQLFETLTRLILERGTEKS